MSPNSSMNTSSSLTRFRLVAFAMLALIFVSIQTDLVAQTTSGAANGSMSWSQSQGAAGASGSFWTGVSSIYGLIYSLFWVAAAIAVAMGWFKFKKGDVQAALMSIGGGSRLCLTPLLIQWVRSLGNSGAIF